MVKITFVASAGSIHSYRWVRYFARVGHEVSLISFHPWGFEKIGGVDLIRVGAPLARVFPPALVVGAYRARGAIARLRPQIVHAHSAGLYGIVGALAGFHPLVLTAWGSDVLVTGRAPLKRHAVRMAVRAPDLITVDADHMRRAIAEMGVSEAKIERINFGTDVGHFRPGLASAILKEKLGIAGSPVVISTRDFRKICNLELLINAVPVVLNKHPDAKFVIIGGGPERESLKELTDRLGVAKSVRFAGRVLPGDLPEYLRTADVYVSTARSDAGLAASTAEAMACELPVIVTDVRDNREWVKDGENGFVVGADDPAGLAEKIGLLFDDEGTRRTFGERSRWIIAERNNFETEMKKMEQLYQRIAGA
jgi:glycosyltransferase involved in cell wall biosynthesis